MWKLQLLGKKCLILFLNIVNNFIGLHIKKKILVLTLSERRTWSSVKRDQYEFLICIRMKKRLVHTHAMQITGIILISVKTADEVQKKKKSKRGCLDGYLRISCDCKRMICIRSSTETSSTSIPKWIGERLKISLDCTAYRANFRNVWFL